MMSTIGLVVSLPPDSSSSEKADGHLSGFLPLRSGIFCLPKSNQLPYRMNDHSRGYFDQRQIGEWGVDPTL